MDPGASGGLFLAPLPLSNLTVTLKRDGSYILAEVFGAQRQPIRLLGSDAHAKKDLFIGVSAPRFNFSSLVPARSLKRTGTSVNEAHFIVSVGSCRLAAWL